MSWYWKQIVDKDTAQDATKAAVGISYFMAALTGLLAVLSLVYQQPIFGLSAWSLADASLFVVIGWRISKMSRAWAVIGIALYVLEAVSSLASRAGGIGVLTIVFILVYVNVVPTENSIALKKREQHSRGNEFLGLRKHLSNRRVVHDPPCRLPEQRITAVWVCVYIKEEAIAQAARRSYRW